MTTDPSLDATVERVARHLAGAWMTESDWGKYPKAFREDYRAYAREVIALAAPAASPVSGQTLRDHVADEPASAGLGVSATPSHTDQAAHPCNAAVLHRLGSASAAHGPHQWTVQSGMEPVHCPGTEAPATDQAAVALAEDLRYLLNYRGPGHDHERPGIWDTSGMPCGHCARLEVARRNLAAYDAGRPAVPPPADRAAIRAEAFREAAVATRRGAFADTFDRMADAELRRLADEAQQQPAAARQDGAQR